MGRTAWRISALGGHQFTTGGVSPVTADAWGLRTGVAAAVRIAFALEGESEGADEASVAAALAVCVQYTAERSVCADESNGVV